MVWFRFVCSVVVMWIKYCFFRFVMVVLFVRLLSVWWFGVWLCWWMIISVIGWSKICISSVLLLIVNSLMIFFSLMMSFIRSWCKLLIVSWSGILLKILKLWLIVCGIWVLIMFCYWKCCFDSIMIFLVCWKNVILMVWKKWWLFICRRLVNLCSLFGRKIVSGLVKIKFIVFFWCGGEISV